MREDETTTMKNRRASIVRDPTTKVRTTERVRTRSGDSTRGGRE